MKQHSSQFLVLVNHAKQQVNEILPKVLKDKIDQKDNFILIDVREDNEWLKGFIHPAIHLSKGIIERDIEKQVPDFNTPLIVYCSGGFRSALVAHSLQQMGYKNVSSMVTGLQGWIDAGFPLEK